MRDFIKKIIMYIIVLIFIIPSTTACSITEHDDNTIESVKGVITEEDKMINMDTTENSNGHTKYGYFPNAIELLIEPESKESKSNILLSTYSSPSLSEDGQGGDKQILLSMEGAFHMNSIYERLLEYGIEVTSEELLNNATVQISDNSKLMAVHYLTSEGQVVYCVVDLSKNEVITSISTNKDVSIDFFPSLEKYLLRDWSKREVYIVDIYENDSYKLNGVGVEALNNYQVSYDEKYIAYTKTVNGDNIIEVFDINKDKITKSVSAVEGERIYISQWYAEDYILFNQGIGAYILNIKTEDINCIGNYMFYPQISPNGKYLAYSLNDVFMNFDAQLDLSAELYSEYLLAKGVYIYNFKTQSSMKLSDEIIVDYKPIQWLDREVLNDDFQRDYPVIMETSSYLQDNNYPFKYSADKAINGEVGDAWVEGDGGDGVGEWIKIIFGIRNNPSSSEVILIQKSVRRLDLVNGYAASELLYNANNRLKEIKLEFSDGSYIIKQLKDNFMDFQSIEFDQPIDTEYIKITVLDIYKGSKYNDTCLSEIKIY